MKVFKFGGASVKDAEGVKNLAEILIKYKEDNPLVVISAMGKTTNALEDVARAFYLNQDDALEKLNYVKQFHDHILTELFDKRHSIYDAVSNLFLEIEWAIEDAPRPNYSYEYDQIVSVGELLSTTIVSAYLKEIGIDNDLLDARDVVKTDNNHQEARIDWDLTSKLILEKVNKDKLTITQGFIGCTSENFTTTLGREGSDYSAAVFATVLEAKELVIWKDRETAVNWLVQGDVMGAAASGYIMLLNNTGSSYANSNFNTTLGASTIVGTGVTQAVPTLSLIHI